MSRFFAATCAAALLATAGCLDTEPATTTLDFDLTVSPLGDNWEPGAADFPVGQEAAVDFVGDRRALPAEVGTASALYQSGTNVSGDLFVFQRKYWSGLRPLTTYKATLQVQFVSNVHSGCTSGLGTGVVIKAGVTSIEPRADPDPQGVYRMSIDKGSGTAAGDFVQLGDIRNGLTGCPAIGTYAVRNTATLPQSTDFTTDDLGGFWMFIGTQSSVLARHEIYITRVGLRIQ
ncbi:MAG TPA: hypothetical protein VGQ69_05345 [Gemmatimonadales bacterium]|nr:hypothetical protein [Gemmatimonadales bacterium]